ncbi:MAG: exodeoxyribonuclease VII small subunit [Sphingomonadaceae bacterium]
MAEERDEIAELSFEEALKRLEEIVRTLESGEASLQQSIDLYAEGDRLKRQCEARLKAAQARIDKILTDADGRPIGTAPLDEA